MAGAGGGTARGAPPRAPRPPRGGAGGTCSARATPPRRCPCSFEAADALLLRAEVRAGAEAVRAAVRAADALGLPEDDRLRGTIAGLQLRLDPSALPVGEHYALAEALAARAAARGWPELEAAAKARLAVLTSNRGRPGEALPLAEAAVALADRHGLGELQVSARSPLGLIRLLSGDVDGAAAAFAELEALGAEHGARALVAADLGWATLRWRTAAPEQAEIHAQRALARATEAGLPLERAKALRALGNAFQRRGDHAEAAAAWRDYVAAARDVGLTSDLPNAWTDLGSALRSLGRLDEAERALQRAVALHRDADQNDVIPRLNLARLYADTERPAEGWALVGPGGIDVARIGWAGLRPLVLALRAALAATLRRREDAAAAVEALLAEDWPPDPSLPEFVALAAERLAEAGYDALAAAITRAAG
ncbi:MAG: tetratricopeptide repeat protein [Myxococcota bacterium]